MTYIQEHHLDHHQSQLYTYYDRHVCGHVRYENAVTCSRLHESQVNCSNTQNCLTYVIPKEDRSTCSLGHADLVWELGQHVSGNYVYGMIDVKPCQPQCVVVNMETTTRFENASTTSFSNISTVLPFVSTDVNSTTTLLVRSVDDESKVDNFEDNTSVMFGWLGASVAVVSIAVVIGVFLWRRRKSSTLAKSGTNISSTKHDTPTLIQLHHIDVIYANDDSLYAGIRTSKMSNFTDIENDSCWSARFSDCTEYDPDFSYIYNDSNISLEATPAYTNPSQHTNSQIYENYSKPTMICLCNSDIKFDKSLSKDCFEGQNAIEVHDDLIYEDFDRSGFDQIVEENSGSEESAYSNMSTDKEIPSARANVVEENSFRNTALSLLKSRRESCRNNDKDSEPDPRNGYSKLNEDLSIIKESYHNLSSSLSLEGKHGNPPFSAVKSPEDRYQSSAQAMRLSLTDDPVEVIDVSLSPRLGMKDVATVAPDISNQVSPKGCVSANKKSCVDAATTQTGEISHFQKARAYFELESNLKSKPQGKQITADVQNARVTTTYEKGDKHKM